jgi:hypothetical protein
MMIAGIVILTHVSGISVMTQENSLKIFGAASGLLVVLL